LETFEEQLRQKKAQTPESHSKRKKGGFIDSLKKRKLIKNDKEIFREKMGEKVEKLSLARRVVLEMEKKKITGEDV